MIVRNTEIDDVKELIPKRFEDTRGYFTEIFNRKALEELGIFVDWVQDSHSFSKERGTLRGLHFQKPPFTQDKLIRVVTGSVYDVAVDLREGSPTYARYVGVHLQSEIGNQLFIPAGFAHGFLTLEPDTHVEYKVSNYYSPPHEKGFCWNDPTLGIKWPLAEEEIFLNKRDNSYASFTEREHCFRFETSERY
jgi:dTDP-4-dehydrorhamnose 3,5-epimerase